MNHDIAVGFIVGTGFVLIAQRLAREIWPLSASPSTREIGDGFPSNDEGWPCACGHGKMRHGGGDTCRGLLQSEAGDVYECPCKGFSPTGFE